MASAEEANGLQQPARMRKLGLGSVMQRPSGIHFSYLLGIGILIGMDMNLSLCHVYCCVHHGI